jgi:serine/threonine protein kinase
MDFFYLKVIYEKHKTGFEEHKDFYALPGDIIATRYEVISMIGEAAFSTTYKCRDLSLQGHGEMLVCLKVIKNKKDFFDQSLDEIKLLKYINLGGDADQFGVLHLIDHFYHKEHLFIVTELLRDNLYEFCKFNNESGDLKYFTIPRLRIITRQLLHSLSFIHGLGLIHCDLKPENILIKSYSKVQIKLIDFGSSCYTTDHLTTYIQSRSYRAPEVILGHPYDQKIDIWSVGCILAEVRDSLVDISVIILLSQSFDTFLFVFATLITFNICIPIAVHKCRFV